MLLFWRILRIKECYDYSSVESLLEKKNDFWSAFPQFNSRCKIKSIYQATYHDRLCRLLTGERKCYVTRAKVFVTCSLVFSLNRDREGNSLEDLLFLLTKVKNMKWETPTRHFGCQTKLPKWNTILLRLKENAHLKGKKISTLPSEKFFFPC